VDAAIKLRLPKNLTLPLPDPMASPLRLARDDPRGALSLHPSDIRPPGFSDQRNANVAQAHCAALPDCDQVGEGGAVPDVGTAISANPSARLVAVVASRSVKLRGTLRLSVLAALIPTAEIAVACAWLVVTFGLGVRVELAPLMPCLTVAVARLGFGAPLGRR
jgi:hypothetical protein